MLVSSSLCTAELTANHIYHHAQRYSSPTLHERVKNPEDWSAGVDLFQCNVFTGQPSLLQLAACEAVAILTALGGKNSASPASPVNPGH